VVWVTGASSGIGRAIAHACARRGDRLVLSSRAADVLDEVRRECEGLGATGVLVQPLDISDGAAVAAAAEAAVATFGRLDVVVQNAGVAAYSRLEDMDDADFDRVLEVNLMGAFRVSKAAVRVFRRQRSGSLVVVGSVLGRLAVPWMGAYVVSKWGLRGLTRVLRAENADIRGIRVTLVSPGGVDTPIYDQSANSIGRRPKPPFPVARPEKVAATVLRAAEASRRELGVGWANPAMVAASSLLPGVWDRVITPAMSLGGLTRTRVTTDEPARSGNLRRARPHLEQLRRDPRAKPDGSRTAPPSAPLVRLGRGGRSSGG
jgi:NAD(P)-dependent dehydrogenase (short-subunit alcohol dehydrogenase family)